MTTRKSSYAPSEVSEILANAPALEGSPKQIAWAEDIRRKNVAAINCMMYIEKAKTLAPEVLDEMWAKIDTCTNPYIKIAVAIFRCKSAKWWIENR